MYSFDYQKAKSVADAAKVLAKDGDAKLLAGGQSLIAAMKLRLAHPSEVIDLGTIKELSGIKADSKAVAIGAMTRHAEVASSAAVKKAIPALASLAAGIGDRMVRNSDLHAKADYRGHLTTGMARRAVEAAMK